MINVKTCITLLLLVCLVNSVIAQKFFQGQIIYKNNIILEGLVKVPDSPNDKKVTFKLTETSEPRKIKSDSIRRIVIFSIEDVKCTLENIEYSKKDQGFSFVIVEGYANLYLTGQGISTDKHGNVSPTASYVSGRSLPEFYYIIKRKNEKYVSTIAITSPSKTMFGQAKAFRKLAAEYFKDYPELVKRINNKEFTAEDVAKVVSIYNEHMGNR